MFTFVTATGGITPFTIYDSLGMRDQSGSLSSPSRDLNTGPADYKSAALPTKPLRRHTILTFDGKKDGAGGLSTRSGWFRICKHGSDIPWMGAE